MNSTFGSTELCSARYGLYICYFPVPYAPIRTGFPALVQKALPGKKPLQHIRIDLGDGWFGHDRGRHVYRWSTEQPTLRVWTPRGVETQVKLIFLRLMPKGADPTDLKFTIDGKTVRTLRIEPGRGEVAVTLPVLGKGLHPTVLQLNCNTFRPQEQFGSDDPRHLGVALVADQSGNPANGSPTPGGTSEHAFDPRRFRSEISWVHLLPAAPSNRAPPPLPGLVRRDRLHLRLHPKVDDEALGPAKPGHHTAGLPAGAGRQRTDHPVGRPVL